MVKKLQYKFFRVLFKTGVINYVNLDLPLTLNTKRLTLPIAGSTGFENIYPGERWLYRVLPVLLTRRPGAFVDVGANTGQTLLKFLTLGVHRPYYAFEPSPAAAAYTRKVAAANEVSDVHVVPVGLSDRTTVTQLFARDDFDASASLVEGYRPSDHYSQSTYVTVFRGDDLADTLGIDEIAVLKIDTEGAEADVLHGLDRTVARTRPAILCEILPVYEEKTERGRMRRERSDQILAFLAKHRYALYLMGSNGHLTRLSTLETHGDLGRCEHLFLPEEDAAYVEQELNGMQGPPPAH